MSNHPRADLTALLTRVEAATGPDRELDVLIFRALDVPLPTEFLNRGISLKWGDDGSALMPVGDMQVRYEPPAYTASLDAALALVEEMLPGWDWSIHCDNGRAIAGIQPPSEDGCDLADCEAATPALAICTAILRALIAKQEVAEHD